MSARWTSAQMASKPAGVAQERRTAHVSTSAPPQLPKGPQNEEKAKPGIPVSPCAYHIGPFRLDVANGTHYPGRMRAVFVGPADEGMLAAVLDAMKNYCSTPPPGA